MQVDAPPKVGRIRRGLIGVLVVFLLSLGLTFGSGTAANAWATPPVPVVVGTALRTVPAGTVTAGICGAAILVCGGLAVGALGLTAYATRDSWLPILGDIINGPDAGNEATKPKASYCATGYSELALGLGATPGTVTFKFNVSHSGSTCTSNWFRIQYQYQCQVGNVYSSGTVSEVYNRGVGSNSMSKNLCGSGSLFYVKIQLEPGYETGPDTPAYARKAYPSANHKTEVTVQCKQPDGTLVSITDSEVGYTDRVAIPSCADRVPGSIPWSGVVKAGPNGGTLKQIQTWQHDQTKVDEYADCFGATGLQCSIRVWVDGAPCQLGDALCAKWPRVQVGEPDRVECRFGSYVVSISQCDPLKKAYDLETEPQPITDVDPSTGAPITDPATDTDTGTPTEGENPTDSGVGTTPDASNPDGSTNRDSASCWGTGWSWNPVSWVVVPLKCVFIPSEGIGARADRLKDRYGGKAPFAFAAGIGGLATAIPENCPNWVIDISPSINDSGTTNKNVVCESSYTAMIRSARPFLTAGMILLAFWPFVRGLVYASTPLVKPVPTDGK